jgi:penicillin-binding protein 2
MSVFNQSRGTVIRLIFFGAMLLLVFRLFQFQVIEKDYSQIADNNAYYKSVVWPARGLFMDRNGIAMVKNIPVYDLQITPNAIKGMDTLAFCRILEIDTATFNEKVREAKFKGGFTKPSIFQSLLSFDMLSKFEEKKYSFPGFDLVQRSERTFPFNAGGNVFGYLNEADTGTIRRSGGYLRGGDVTGIIGLEKFYDRVIRGERGVEIFVRDSKQKIVEKYKDGKYDTLPVAGRNLKTFMDIKLQQLAEKLMKNKLGAAVAIEPKTGGILAMATGPGYDPNLLTGEAKRQNLNALLQDPTMPLLNFAIKGTYPPGSTFKPLGGLIALDEGVMVPSNTIGCGGRYRACGGKGVGCHGGHTVNLKNALAVSCNSYFSAVFRKALDNPAYANVEEGYLKWKQYLSDFGLGHRLGVDLPGELRGLVPDTGKIRKERGRNWSSCNVLTLGIGQDQMLTTPLQMANAMCFIANKGYYYIPHFVDSIVGETKNDTILKKYRTKHIPINIPDSSFEAVHDGMQAVLEEGTARKSMLKGITMCGKTGTADNFFKGKAQKPHSWFVCFAPRENPKIAIAILVQNAGQGATYGAPIASLMVEQFLKDSLSPSSKKKAEALSKVSIIPNDVKYKKYVRDSTVAFDKFEETGDTSWIRAYLPPPAPVVINVNKDSLAKVEKLQAEKNKEKEKKEQDKKTKDSANKNKDAVLPKPPTTKTEKDKSKTDPKKVNLP